MHVVDAEVVEIVPATQSVQAPWPIEGAYFPGGAREG